MELIERRGRLAKLNELTRRYAQQYKTITPDVTLTWVIGVQDTETAFSGGSLSEHIVEIIERCLKETHIPYVCRDAFSGMMSGKRYRLEVSLADIPLERGELTGHIVGIL